MRRKKTIKCKAKKTAKHKPVDADIEEVSTLKEKLMVSEATGTTEEKSPEKVLDELADLHGQDFLDALVAAYVLVGVLQRVCIVAPEDEFLGMIVRAFWMVGDDHQEHEPTQFANQLRIGALNLLLRADHMEIKKSPTSARLLLDSFYEHMEQLKGATNDD